MIELKQCPFCGGNARFFFIKAKSGSIDRVGVECIKCGAAPFCVASITLVYGEQDAKETAAEHWNRRK